MTALVYLLFIAMIPIDCKLQFFTYTCWIHMLTSIDTFIIILEV